MTEAVLKSVPTTGISLRFGVACGHCKKLAKITAFIMDQSVKVASTEGKVGAYFRRLTPLNESTA